MPSSRFAWLALFPLVAGCAPGVPMAMKLAPSVANPEIATNPPEMPTSTEAIALPQVIDLVRDKHATEDRHGSRYMITLYAKTRMCFYSTQFRDGVERYADKSKSFELLVADEPKQLLADDGTGARPVPAEVKVLGDLPNVQSKGARLYVCFQSNEPLLTASSRWLMLRAVTNGGEKKAWDDARVYFRLADVEADKAAAAARPAEPGRVVRTRKL